MRFSIIKEDIVKPDIKKNDLSIDEIARYSGGSKYTLDEKKALIADAMLEKAVHLALPLYTYSGFQVLHHKKGQSMQLPGAVIETPVFISSKVSGVIALICTIGAKIENEITALTKNNELLNAFFLNAAGLAILDAITKAAYQQIADRLAAIGFYTGCSWEPGCEKTSMEGQKLLFDLLSPKLIGVTITKDFILLPYKTVSCWICITKNSIKKDNENKCSQCSLKNCLYRKS